MKKLMVLILVLALSSPISGISAHAAEYSDPWDARYIPPEILAVIDGDDTEMVICWWPVSIGVDFLYEFHDDIDDILDDYRYTYYAQKTSTGWNYYLLCQNGEVVERTPHYPNHYALYFDERETLINEFLTGEAIKTVSPEIAIQSIYYLCAEGEHLGSAIYYKTNLGNYVYYLDYRHGGQIFSDAAFWEYRQAYFNAYTSNLPTTGGTDSGDAWDLSAYDYTSPNFNPNAPFPKKDSGTTNTPVAAADPEDSSVDPILLWGGIATGVVLVAFAVVFCVVRAKKKRKVSVTSQENPAME